MLIVSSDFSRVRKGGVDVNVDFSIRLLMWSC